MAKLHTYEFGGGAFRSPSTQTQSKTRKKSNSIEYVDLMGPIRARRLSGRADQANDRRSNALSAVRYLIDKQ